MLTTAPPAAASTISFVFTLDVDEVRSGESATHTATVTLADGSPGEGEIRFVADGLGKVTVPLVDGSATWYGPVYYGAAGVTTDQYAVWVQPNGAEWASDSVWLPTIPWEVDAEITTIPDSPLTQQAVSTHIQLTSEGGVPTGTVELWWMTDEPQKLYTWTLEDGAATNFLGAWSEPTSTPYRYVYVGDPKAGWPEDGYSWDFTVDVDEGVRVDVVRTGTGMGRVTSDPGGVDCATPSCEVSMFIVPPWTEVTVTATADDDSIFEGWDIDECEDEPTCTVVVEADTTLTATFTKKPTVRYPLTMSTSGAGSGKIHYGSPAVACTASPCSATFVSGTRVVLGAVANTGSSFVGWTGGGCSGKGACVVTMSQAKTVTATFALNKYWLSVTKSGGTGVVTSSVGGLSCGRTCRVQFSYAKSVTLTATPSRGMTFIGWSGAGCRGTKPCVVKMSQTRNVVATFARAKR